MNKELLKACIRDRFDSVDLRYRSDLQRQDEREDLIALCYELELDNAFIEDLKNDERFKPE